MFDHIKTTTGKELPFGYVFAMRPLEIDDDGNLFYQTGAYDEKGRRQGGHVTDARVIKGIGESREQIIQDAFYKNGCIQFVEQWDIETGEKCLRIEAFDHRQNPQGRYYKKQNGQTWDGYYEGVQFTGTVMTVKEGTWRKETLTMGLLRAEYEKKFNEKGCFFERQVKYDFEGNILYRKTNKKGIICIDYQNGKKLERPILSTPKMRRNSLILKCCGIALAATFLAVGGVKVASWISGPVPSAQQARMR